VIGILAFIACLIGAFLLQQIGLVIIALVIYANVALIELSMAVSKLERWTLELRSAFNELWVKNVKYNLETKSALGRLESKP
jgi:hypothetical protein